jgi:PAS domain S-box-containing protein
MDTHVLIPLIAVLTGSVFAGTLLARGGRLRVNRLVSQMLGWGTAWAIAELMAAATPDPFQATLWLRFAAVVAFGLGPLSIFTLIELRPDHRARLRPLAFAGIWGGVVLSCISLLTPLYIQEAVPSAAGGWMPRFNSMAAVIFGLQMVLPVVSTVLVLRTAHDDTRRLEPLLGIAIAVPLTTVLVTDVILPLAGVPFPRLGAATVVIVGGGIWLYCFRTIEGPLSESGFARAILANLPDAVALLERDGQIRSANPSFSRLAGRDGRDLIGRSIHDLVRLDAGELQDELAERETLLVVDGDESVPVPVAVSSSPILDRQEGVIGQVLVIRDLRAVVGLRRHMVASGRLAAVGELAAGIAHEVNNPIAFMQSNLNLLRRHYDTLEAELAEPRGESSDLGSALDAVPRPIEDSLAGIARVAAIVRDVRSFAHAGSVEHQSCDVNELLESTIRLATLKHEFFAQIERDYGELPPFQGAGQDLKQVFLSLTRRATEAVGAFGRIKLKTRLHGDFVEVSIEDDGAEVSEAELRYLFHASFDPVVERPASLELGISQQIVEEHGGELEVERREDGWTCVRVLLPVQGGDAREVAISRGQMA